MKKTGYVRVSSECQNPSRQLEQLNKIGMDQIYQEVESGVNINKTQFSKMLNKLEQGNTIYISDLTRITRSTQDLFSLVDQMKKKRANLISLKDT